MAPSLSSSLVWIHRDKCGGPQVVGSQGRSPAPVACPWPSTAIQVLVLGVAGQRRGLFG